MVAAEEMNALGAAATAELRANAKRSRGQTKPLRIAGPRLGKAVSCAPMPNELADELTGTLNEVTTLPQMPLLLNTYNAGVQRPDEPAGRVRSAGTRCWASLAPAAASGR